MSVSAAKGNTGRGNLPQAWKDARASAVSQSPTSVTSGVISAAEIAAARLQEEDCDHSNTELLEHIVNQDNRMQPDEWEGLPESGRTAVQVDHNEELTNVTDDNEIVQKIKDREAWIRMWVAKVSCRVLAHKKLTDFPAEQRQNQSSDSPRQSNMRFMRPRPDYYRHSEGEEMELLNPRRTSQELVP